jgi:tetratricopeptide (TPR) repeat protein
MNYLKKAKLIKLFIEQQQITMLNCFLIFLFFGNVCFSQEIEEKKLVIDGEKAFSDKNYQLAKEIYTNATTLYPKSKDFWFNLAAVELDLKENETAGEHFYQAYKLGDQEALNAIRENCPNFRNGTILSILDVEEKPKFIYNGKEYYFGANNNIDPIFQKVVVREFQKSNILKENAKGKMFIRFKIDKSNVLEVEILKMQEDEKKDKLVKQEITSVLKNMVAYVSAKNKGLNVDTFETWGFPIVF